MYIACFKNKAFVVSAGDFNGFLVIILTFEASEMQSSFTMKNP